MLDPDAPTGAETPESAEPNDARPALFDAPPAPAEAAPPRRRRAASRPAGPPRAIEPTPAVAQIAPPVAEPEAVEAEWSEVSAEGPLVEVAVEEVAEPEAVAAPEAADADDEEQPAEESPEAPVEPDAVDADEAESVVEPAPEPAPRRRTSRRRAAPAAEAVDAAAPLPAETDADAPAADANDAPATDTPPAKPTTRRRRATRAASAPAPAPSDDVAASLQQLAGSVAGPDATGEPAAPKDVSIALDDLAAAIGEREDEESDAFEAEGDDDSADDDSPRRRRRRRGGRRRRRGSDASTGTAEGEADDADDSDDDESDAEAGVPSTDADSESDTDSDDADASTDAEPGDVTPSGRRRRRRRRRGEDTTSTDDEGVDVVVKVREPRRARTSEGKASDEITGIEGSTRMEAKRQRRREGRAAGRRRAPVLSEAEFLARRESVERMMLIRQADDYTQIGVLEDGVLVEHYVDRASSSSLIGNVYLGRVQNVLPSMEAAFIDIGRGRNAVLYAGEVDWDGFGVTGDERKVEKVLKSGQAVLVQVTKDPIGAKGARLTGHLSLPGRYVVYSPNGQLSGISRKLPDHERARLKSVLDEVVGEDASVIVRTAAEGASEDELIHDVNRLKAQWEVIEKKVKAGQAPQALYSEPDLTVRIVRDLFTEDFSTLIVDGNGRGQDAWDTVEAYVTHVAPHLAPRLRRWDRESEGDLFATFRVHEQVAKALERRVHLPSGGSLVIDRTEAMTVVDVNTGKFTGTSGNLEATVTSNNLEAAEEVVRQLRLRDIGGIIIIDFIDMVLPANRELLLRRLVECLGRDRTRHQVAEVTSLGLVQMTRKRIGTGLAEAFTVPCETCHGRGYHVHDAPVTTQSAPDGGDRDGAGRRGAGRPPRS